MVRIQYAHQTTPSSRRQRFVPANGNASVTIADSDPRVFFAAERTLLAWLRTGLTVIALGFVIARFGLFLRLVALQVPNTTDDRLHASAILGIVFVVVGAISILVAAVQHSRFVRTLALVDLPASYSRTIALILSWVVGVLGLLLAAYLTMST